MAYEKQTWDTGTVIPESKLLHVEDGIFDATETADQNAEDIKQNKEETDAAIENLSDDVDKKYDELNSALAENIVVEKVNLDDQEISSSSTITVDIDVSKSGYSVLGLAGFAMTNANTNGVNSSWCTSWGQNINYPNSGNIRVYVRNTNTSATARILINLWVLYKKN